MFERLIGGITGCSPGTPSRFPVLENPDTALERLARLRALYTKSADPTRLGAARIGV